MMSKKSFFLYLSIATLFVVLFFDFLYFFEVSRLPLALIVLINIALAIQFIAGGLIVVAGKQNNPESFSQRFLLLTTFQLFSVLTVILIIWYGSKDVLKPFLIQYVGLFAVLMIIQTLLLIRLSKSTEE